MADDLPQPDFRSQAFRREAYTRYAEMRRQNPIFHAVDIDGEPTWFILRYADARAVLQDDRRFVKDPKRIYSSERLADAPPFPDLDGFVGNHMLFKDPPDHTRLRTLVNKAFTQRMVAEFEDRMRGITDELIDRVHAAGEMDLIGDFAYPMPLRIIAELLGVPAEDYAKFQLWSTAVVTLPIDETEKKQFSDYLQAFVAYLRDLFDARRAQAGDDLISMLIAAEQDGDRLTEQELFSMVVLLIVTGHVTTVNFIGNGMLALLQHPNTLAWLRDNPAQLGHAIEEMIRYDGPVERATYRWTAEDVDFGWQTISQGERVIVVLGAANRDPEAFPNPDVFDIRRRDNRHLGFGHGIHYCLGAWLGRMEGRIAFETLLRRLPGVKLNGSPDDLIWRRNVMLRGLAHLPIVW